MAKAQMVGGPDDGKDDILVEPGQKTIEIHVNGKRYVMPIRNHRIYWNERRAL
jgi:hypothetical protein